MKSFRKELWFELPARVGFVNITPQVEACFARERGRRRSGIGERDAHYRIGFHQ